MKKFTEARITERNIKAIHQHEKAELDRAPRALKITHKITFFAGTVTFVLLNAVIFTTWILINSVTPWKFDPYPFTLLTMAVSLEAIFLSTFVLISQNALAVHSERRHMLNLHVGLLAEEEDTAMLKLLDKIAERMGISEEDRAEAKLMSGDVDPEQILEQIAKIEKGD